MTEPIKFRTTTARTVRSRLTLENDDKTFTPADLLPVCLETGVPLVYDVHHHRCLPDKWSAEVATEKACSTWRREPLFHISSPLQGWPRPAPERHHDHINRQICEDEGLADAIGDPNTLVTCG